MTADRVSELRDYLLGLVETAEAAIPGPWKCVAGDDQISIRKASDPSHIYTEVAVTTQVAWTGDGDDDWVSPTAVLVARMDPERVLRLARADLLLIEEHKVTDGVCDKCRTYGVNENCDLILSRAEAWLGPEVTA